MHMPPSYLVLNQLILSHLLDTQSLGTQPLSTNIFWAPYWHSASCQNYVLHCLNLFNLQVCHMEEAQDCHNIAAALTRAQEVDETECK